MATQLTLGEFAVDVVFKDIRNVHLSVYPPTGQVRISAPSRMSLDRVRLFALSRLAWIRQQRHKLRDQEREAARDYLDRESHYVWGERYLLSVAESDETPSVVLKHRRMILTVRAGSDDAAKEAVVARWYRQQVKAVVPALMSKWEPILGVSVQRVFVQRMKTMWGSCNPRTPAIRLNTELAKKPRECLEYILVHEMIHLLEPTHNGRFRALMDQFMPKWQFYRAELNRLPVRCEEWVY